MFLKKWSLLFFSILLLACSASEHSKPTIKRDLGAILKDGKLRVSTTYSSTSYFLYRGETLGFEYEMLSRFAKHLGVELEVVIATDIDSLIPNLIVGKVDLMAHGLTITKNRQKQVAFSESIYLTHQVLVQKKPENWRKMKLHEIDEYLIRDAVELEGKTISVRAKTSYYERLKNLSEEIGASITIEKLDGTLTTDEIIEMVAEGKIKYTISDENLASLLAASNPILDVRVPVGLSQKSAWATRKNSPKLLNELDSWLTDFKKTADYNVIYKKYFKNKRSFRKRAKRDFYSIKTFSISKYDDLVRKESEKLDWEWS